MRRKKYIVLIACILNTTPALALDKIYSPNVEYREMSFEYNGSRTFDNHADKNDIQGQEYAVEAGLTPHWEVEAGGIFGKEAGKSLKLDAGEIENRFQFFEQGENWLDSGMLVAYDFSTQSHTPDSLEVKLLLQKDIGWATSTANIGFNQNVGEYAAHTGGPDYVLLWNTRYRFSQYFQPGIELQSDFGQDRELSQLNRQEHYIGPAIYGKLYGRLNYQAAWLFGATQASAQNAARLLVEYEMHF